MKEEKIKLIEALEEEFLEKWISFDRDTDEVKFRYSDYRKFLSHLEEMKKDI